jgi:hypothetical protein
MKGRLLLCLMDQSIKIGRWPAQKIDRPNKNGQACDVPRTDDSMKRTIVIQWMKLNGVTWLLDN